MRTLFFFPLKLGKWSGDKTEKSVFLGWEPPNHVQPLSLASDFLALLRHEHIKPYQ